MIAAVDIFSIDSFGLKKGQAMFPLFSEIVLRTPALLKGDVFPIYSFEISLILVIICISAFDICNRKNGLFLKIKKFKRLVKLVNQYPGLNFYPLIGSTAEMAHLFFQPCRGTIKIKI